MKCSYHPDVDSQEACTVCRKLLCTECAHKIKGKPYCQDCLVQGAEWAATVKGLKLPSDSPKRAAFCAIIPGMGAVYNGEYMKAITYFAVFAALSMMGDRVNGVFGFGAFVFVLFTMFDAYRTAEAKARRKIQAGFVPEETGSPGQNHRRLGDPSDRPRYRFPSAKPDSLPIFEPAMAGRVHSGWRLSRLPRDRSPGQEARQPGRSNPGSEGGYLICPGALSAVH